MHALLSGVHEATGAIVEEPAEKFVNTPDRPSYQVTPPQSPTSNKHTKFVLLSFRSKCITDLEVIIEQLYLQCTWVFCKQWMFFEQLSITIISEFSRRLLM